MAVVVDEHRLDLRVPGELPDSPHVAPEGVERGRLAHHDVLEHRFRMHPLDHIDDAVAVRLRRGKHHARQVVEGLKLKIAEIKPALPPGVVLSVFLTLGVAASLYGVTDEVHQLYVPFRESSWQDWLADVTGSTAGAVAGRRLFGTSWSASAAQFP